MNRYWIFAALLALLIGAAGCGSDDVGTDTAESDEPSVSSVATLDEPEPETEPEDLPQFWPDYENVNVNPFTANELQEAYDIALAKLRETPTMGSLERLCFDPVLTHHDAVAACSAEEMPGWELDRYFSNRISFTYVFITADESGAERTVRGSIRLHRTNDRELWAAETPVELQCEQSAFLRTGEELSVLFDDCLCGYELEDGSVMAYCHRAGTDRIALQTGSMPWGGKPKSVDSGFYFNTLHEFSDGDLNYEPGWLGAELTIGLSEDGMVGLYRNGSLLWNYFDADCEYRFGESWIYYLDGNTLNRVDYAGRSHQLLFAGDALSSTFYVAQDTLFFICRSDGQSAVYRLFAEDRRCDLLSAQIPVPLEDVALDPPISNVQVVWSYVNPEFTELAEAERETYEDEYGELDNMTYYGMLEQDYEVYSQIICYKDTLTNEYYEMRSGWIFLGPDRTAENIEKNGSQWWLDFRPEDFDPHPTTGLEDAPA